MKYLIILFLIISCNTNASVFDVAVDNFRYIPDMEEPKNVKENLKSLVISDITEKFYGDCEDFAFSLQQAMGGKVWYTILKDEGAHAVLVKNGVVYDFYKGKMLVNEYPSKLLFWFSLDGSYGTDI